MKKIKLTQGQEAIVDDEDYKKLNKYKWYAHNDHNSIFYAERYNGVKNGKKLPHIRMHREVLNLKSKDKRKVDHKNGDGLDNRKENLRICSNAQNQMNKKISSNNTSGYKGVYLDKSTKKWRACIYLNYKQISLGSFNNKDDAAKAYNEAAIKYYREFANLNKI